MLILRTLLSLFCVIFLFGSYPSEGQSQTKPAQKKVKPLDRKTQTAATKTKDVQRRVAKKRTIVDNKKRTIVDKLKGREINFIFGVGDTATAELKNFLDYYFVVSAEDFRHFSPWIVTRNGYGPKGILEAGQLEALKIMAGEMQFCEAEKESIIPGVSDLRGMIRKRQSSGLFGRFGSKFRNIFSGRDRLEDMRFFGACPKECEQEQGAQGGPGADSVIAGRKGKKERVGDRDCSSGGGVQHVATEGGGGGGDGAGRVVTSEGGGGGGHVAATEGSGGGGGPGGVAREVSGGGAPKKDSCATEETDITHAIINAVFSRYHGTATKSGGSPISSAAKANGGMDSRRASGDPTEGPGYSEGDDIIFRDDKGNTYFYQIDPDGNLVPSGIVHATTPGERPHITIIGASLDKERADKEKADKEKADKEKADKEKADKEKADKEKADKEKADKEKEKPAEGPAGGVDPNETDCPPDAVSCGERLTPNVQILAKYYNFGPGVGVVLLPRDVSQYINPGVEGGQGSGSLPFRSPLDVTARIYPRPEGGGISHLLCDCGSHCTFGSVSVLQEGLRPDDPCLTMDSPDCNEQRLPMIPTSPVHIQEGNIPEANFPRGIR